MRHALHQTDSLTNAKGNTTKDGERPSHGNVVKSLCADFGAGCCVSPIRTYWAGTQRRAPCAGFEGREDAGRPQVSSSAASSRPGRRGRWSIVPVCLGTGLVSLPGIEPTLDELPALLTVDDVAAVLRIGKSLAYTLARQYEASGETQGVPVIRVDCSLRSPRWVIAHLDGTHGCLDVPSHINFGL